MLPLQWAVVVMGTHKKGAFSVSGVRGGFLKEDTFKPNQLGEDWPRQRGEHVWKSLEIKGTQGAWKAGVPVQRALALQALLKSLYFVLKVRALEIEPGEGPSQLCLLKIPPGQMIWLSSLFSSSLEWRCYPSTRPRYWHASCEFPGSVRYRHRWQEVGRAIAVIVIWVRDEGSLNEHVEKSGLFKSYWRMFSETWSWVGRGRRGTRGVQDTGRCLAWALGCPMAVVIQTRVWEEGLRSPSVFVLGVMSWRCLWDIWVDMLWRSSDGAWHMGRTKSVLVRGKMMLGMSPGWERMIWETWTPTKNNVQNTFEQSVCTFTRSFPSLLPSFAFSYISGTKEH